MCLKQIHIIHKMLILNNSNKILYSIHTRMFQMKVITVNRYASNSMYANCLAFIFFMFNYIIQKIVSDSCVYNFVILNLFQLAPKSKYLRKNAVIICLLIAKQFLSLNPIKKKNYNKHCLSRNESASLINFSD